MGGPGPVVGEDLTGQDPPVDAVDLTHGGDVAAQPPALGEAVLPGQEDDEVDGAGDQEVGGVLGQVLGRLDGVGGDAVEHLGGGVRVDGGQRAVVALAHGVEHGDDLVTQDLTDDDP